MDIVGGSRSTVGNAVITSTLDTV
eukprot:Gb_16928 [translate_table: standard]